MNQAIRIRWTEALRSGKYLQGHGCLKRMDENNRYRHCCLGVLTELYLAETGEGSWEPLLLSPDKQAFENAGQINAVYLPNDVLTWAGLTDFDAYGYAKLNDMHRYSFAEIANDIDSKNENAA